MEDPRRARILLVDDDPNFLKVAEFNLSRTEAEIAAFSNATDALAAFKSDPFDLVLSDVKMPGMDGLTLLQKVRALAPAIPVILITAHGDIEMAVQAMQMGANDFLTKPFKREILLEKVDRALKVRVLERENRALREELTDRFSFKSIVGSSPAMRQLFETMSRVAERDTTVLILGESGTGKELVARALHYSGPRRGGRFVAVNCAAIPPALLASELFGHIKGAFTGADAAREGRFVAASGGTLFLDEVGDMPLDLQASVLRALQERQVEPVGADHPVAVDVRILAATHQDLEKQVQDGTFRQDLYYRLCVVPLHVPPLRDRIEDIPLLVKHFLERFDEPHVRVEPEVFEELSRHNWPGNVRELENAIERALALRSDPTRLAGHDIVLPAAPERLTLFEVPDQGVNIDEIEKSLVASALRKAGNNQTRAARLLGLSRQQLIYRMHKYEVS
jgi:two-component system NtrC family response regulator